MSGSSSVLWSSGTAMKPMRTLPSSLRSLTTSIPSPSPTVMYPAWTKSSTLALLNSNVAVFSSGMSITIELFPMLAHPAASIASIITIANVNTIVFLSILVFLQTNFDQNIVFLNCLTLYTKMFAKCHVFCEETKHSLPLFHGEETGNSVLL